MKRKKRIFSALLSLAMLLALTQPALAGEFNNYGTFNNRGEAENTGVFVNGGCLLNAGRFVNAAGGQVENTAYRVGTRVEGLVHDSFSGNQGCAISYEISGSTLVVSGVGAMPRFVDEFGRQIHDTPWSSCSYDSTITDIVIEEGITSVGACAFFGFSCIHHVSLPSTLTAVGDAAFAYCTELESVTLPEGLKVIGDSAFYGCTAMTAVTVPASVTAIGEQVFGCCMNLAEIAVEDGSETYVSVDKVLFTRDLATLVAYPCAANVSNGLYVIPDNVTAIAGAAFEGAELICITVPARVTSIGENAFANSYLQGAEIFANVSELPSFLFYGCTLLTSVAIPASVTGVGKNAFTDTPLVSVSYGGDSQKYAALLAAADVGNEPLLAASVCYVGASDIVFISMADARSQAFRCIFQSGAEKFIASEVPIVSGALPAVGWYRITYGTGRITSLQRLSGETDDGYFVAEAALAAADQVDSFGEVLAATDTPYILLDGDLLMQGVFIGDTSDAIVPLPPADEQGRNAYYLCDANRNILSAVVIGKAEGVSAIYNASCDLERVNGTPTGELEMTLTLPNETPQYYTVLLISDDGIVTSGCCDMFSSTDNKLFLSDMPAGVYDSVEIYSGLSTTLETQVLSKRLDKRLESTEIDEPTPLGTAVPAITHNADEGEYTFHCLLPGYVYMVDDLFTVTAEMNTLQTSGYSEFVLKAEKWEESPSQTGYLLKRCKETAAIAVTQEGSADYDVSFAISKKNDFTNGYIEGVLTLPNETEQTYTVVLKNEKNNAINGVVDEWSKTQNSFYKAYEDLEEGVYSRVQLYSGSGADPDALVFEKTLQAPLKAVTVDETAPLNGTAAVPVTCAASGNGEYIYTFNCLLPGYLYWVEAGGGKYILSGKYNTLTLPNKLSSLSLHALQWNESAEGLTQTRYKETGSIAVTDAQSEETRYFFAMSVDSQKSLISGVATYMSYDTPQKLNDVKYTLAENAAPSDLWKWYACSWSNGAMIPQEIPEYSTYQPALNSVYSLRLDTGKNSGMNYGTFSDKAADDKTVYYYCYSENGEDVVASYKGVGGNGINLPAAAEGYTVYGLFRGSVFLYAVVVKNQLS